MRLSDLLRRDRWGFQRTFRSPLRRRRVFDDIDSELRHHLEQSIEVLVRAGMTRELAECEARRRFGSVDRVRRELTEAEMTAARAVARRERLQALATDVRRSARALLRAPASTAVAVATIGLSSAAAVALLTVLEMTLIRPMPFPEPDQLASVGRTQPDSRAVNWRVSRSRLDSWRKDSGVPMAFYSVVHPLRTDLEVPERIRTVVAGPNLIDVLGLAPAHGRGFAAPDFELEESSVVVLSAAYAAALGGRQVIGSTIAIEGRDHRVIGVMPAAWRFPAMVAADAIVPAGRKGSSGPAALDSVLVVARLAGPIHEAGEWHGATIPSTTESAGAFFVAPLARTPLGEATADALKLLVVSGLVVVGIAFATVANLSVGRAVAAHGAANLRLTLGATRSRLLQGAVVEASFGSLGGVVVGWLLARASLGMFVAIAPGSIGRAVSQSAISPLGALLLVVLTCCFGLVLVLPPALSVMSAAGNADRAGSAGTALWTPRLRAVLDGVVVMQIALAFVLIAGAGLTASSFWKLTAVDPGFEWQRVGSVAPDLSEDRYSNPEDRVRLLSRLARAMRAMPGVEGSAIGYGLPPASRFLVGGALEARDATPTQGVAPYWVPVTKISPGYLDLIGTQIVAGRDFQHGEAPEANTAIVDAALAEHLWPGESAVGRQFRYRQDGSEPWLSVVGVVADMKLLGRDDRRGRYDIARPVGPRADETILAVVYRTSGDPEALFADIRRTVRSLDPRLPASLVTSGAMTLGSTVVESRFTTYVSIGMAAVAGSIAVLGVAVLAGLAVSQRRREVGLRMALGASAAAARRVALRRILALSSAGLAIGLMAVDLVAPFLAEPLYEPSGLDPATLVMLSLGVLASAALAADLAGRRVDLDHLHEVLRGE